MLSYTTTQAKTDLWIVCWDIIVKVLGWQQFHFALSYSRYVFWCVLFVAPEHNFLPGNITRVNLLCCHLELKTVSQLHTRESHVMEEIGRRKFIGVKVRKFSTRVYYPLSPLVLKCRESLTFPRLLAHADFDKKSKCKVICYFESERSVKLNVCYCYYCKPLYT